MVPLLNRHSFLEAMHLPMESYSKLLSEASHVQPIWCPLIVSEAGYVDGSDFASHGIAVPVLSLLSFASFAFPVLSLSPLKHGVVE
jgi:hypothetical protein